MAENRQEFNSNQTRQHLIDTFFELYSRMELEKISIKLLCDKSGVSRASFYKYFSDKYDLLETAENKLLDDMASLNRDLVYMDYSKYKRGEPFPNLYEVICYIHENRHIFKTLLSGRGDAQFQYRWKRNISYSIRQKLSHDATRYRYMHRGAVEYMLASSLIALYTYWLFDDNDISCIELSSMAAQVVFGSFYNFREDVTEAAR